jgi:death-on-curing protein
MRYLTLDEILELHRLALAQSGGAPGVRDLGGLESAVVQPYMTFGGQELYPTLGEKAAALAFSRSAIIPLSTATNGSATRPWKRS